MSSSNHFKPLAAAALAWLLLALTGIAQTTNRMSTRFLARGERALLEVSVICEIGESVESIPLIPTVRNVGIRPSGFGAESRRLTGRKIEHVFKYQIESYEIGTHVIPPIEVVVAGRETRTEPLEFRIFNPDELEWAEVELNGTTLRYACSFHTMNLSPFEGQTTHTEIKVFVPRGLRVEDWGIPEFERDGLTAWRFQPSNMQSEINLFGQPHISVAYPSTITPTRNGKVAIGPAKVRLTTIQTIMDPFSRGRFEYVFLDIPRLEFDVKELPKNAPEGFDNAVGSFRLSASTTLTDVKEGEPISVDLMVTGSGNLDNLRAPRLLDETGWKVYEPTVDQRGDERRELSGTVIFRQFMRPLELKSMIPPFRLVYFDPDEETYKTVTTEPIALNMTPGATPLATTGGTVPSLPMPVERMTDILAILKVGQLTMPALPSLPLWIGHLLAGLVALGLIAKAAWMRIAPRLKKNPDREARIQALRGIETNASASDVEFLKASGSYIEAWLGAKQDSELQAILDERDAVCFRSEKPQSVLDRKRRDSILKTLRKAATTLLVCALASVTIPQASAEDVASQAIEAYESAKYDDAIKLWLGAGDYSSLSAETLYNIGNACYRSGSPGHAALYYRRALTRDAGHEESRQNLRFIERKYGAITVQRPEYQYALTKFSLSTWKSLLWAGLWLCAISLLVFPATRSGNRLRVAAVVTLVIAPLIASVGALGWRYFPNDSEFAPLARQAVIIPEKTVLHADAARTSPEVIDAPPGSLCEIIRESGGWAYVAFATKTRGWVPIESIEKILPDAPPEPPKFNKPKADGKTA